MIVMMASPRAPRPAARLKPPLRQTPVWQTKPGARSTSMYIYIYIYICIYIYIYIYTYGNVLTEGFSCF